MLLLCDEFSNDLSGIFYAEICYSVGKLGIVGRAIQCGKSGIVIRAMKCGKLGKWERI